MIENKIAFEQDFHLESGDVLPGLEIQYHSTGKLNDTCDNVVWICHALTANSDVIAWWPGMIGPGLLYDPDEYFIICANILGSCYGTTGPESINPASGNPYGKEFPAITVKDMVKAHQMLRKRLKIREIDILTGGSLGGQQALEWAVSEPDLIQHLIPIATNAIASPWGIAFNESQRMALEADQDFQKGVYTGSSAGMRAARSIALLSYRNGNTYNKTQADPDPDKLGDYKAVSYQQYQGKKLEKRFNPFAYYLLSKALDSQNLGRGRQGLDSALACVTAKTLAIGITSDLLFPVEEQKLIAGKIGGALYREVESFYGHDGFLIESDAISKEIKQFISQ
jgi:homoserine O-acetyltransferase/O-succinyltransferase